MKTTIAFIALLLCIALSASAEWLETEFSFQAGWIPKGYIGFYEPNKQIYNQAQPFDASFSISSIFWKYILIKGTMNCNFSYCPSDYNIFNFLPTGMTYAIQAGIVFNDNFRIVYEHSCSHPVLTWYYVNDLPGAPALDALYDRVFIEFRTSFSF